MRMSPYGPPPYRTGPSCERGPSRCPFSWPILATGPPPGGPPNLSVSEIRESEGTTREGPAKWTKGLSRVLPLPPLQQPYILSGFLKSVPYPGR